MLTYKFPNNLPWFLVFLCFQIIVPIVTYMEIYVSHIHPCTHILFHSSLKPNLSKTCKVLKEVTAAYDVVCYLIVIVVQKFDVYNVFVFSLCPMECCVSYHPTEP